jgi:hypothetical protein
MVRMQFLLQIFLPALPKSTTASYTTFFPILILRYNFALNAQLRARVDYVEIFA